MDNVCFTGAFATALWRRYSYIMNQILSSNEIPAHAERCLYLIAYLIGGI